MNISTMEWRSFLRAYWVFTLSLSRCFSIELKQDNQATIHHGSSTLIPYFGLETNSFRRFMMFLFSLLMLTEFFFFFCNQAQRVCSQWTQTGKPTNDFSMLLQLEPSTISWSIQRIYLYLGWSNVYNIHSLIHCCSTVELIIFVKNKSKTNPTFPTSVHWFFVSYIMCFQEAFNVKTVHVKINMIS